MSLKKVALFVMSRANYGRLKPIIDLIHKDKELELQLIVGASFYNTEIEYPVSSKIAGLVDCGDSKGMVATTGMLAIQIGIELERLKPDLAIVHGDRYEVLACALACSYMNIPLAHTEGGEVTGCIDDKVRNAITMLADYHFPTTEESEYRLVFDLNRNPKYVYNVGSLPLANFRHIPLRKPLLDKYILYLFHPNTTKQESVITLAEVALHMESLGYDTIWVCPNVDAGSIEIVDLLRTYKIDVVTDLYPEDFYSLLKHSECAVGNSSSFIKEGAFLEVPVVLVGDRQENREIDKNIISVSNNYDSILKAINIQLEAKYKYTGKFGDGYSDIRILEILKGVLK